MKDKVKQWVGAVVTFGSEVRTEVVKSTWPSRAELIESTVVILLTVVLLSLFVGVSDTLIGFLVKRLF
jgi:preprotein translocase subunit SecE